LWLDSTRGIEQGESLLPGFESLGILSPLTLELLRVGEEMGTLDLMLSRAATLYEIELECRWP
jgi:type II secretory pathway component PulF